MVTLNREAWNTFVRFLGVNVVWPEDVRYDDWRRGYNSMHDARPGLIVRPRSAAEVVAILDLAIRTSSSIAVRGGGHSIAGFSTTEGGVLIDLSNLKDIEIVNGEVRVGAGVTAGELTQALAPLGKVVPFGDSPSVGIAGITLGGGIGWLGRKIGLTLDCLVGAQLVIADGTVVEVDAANHKDLFWAIRGGGGNFGAVTRFDFQLHDLGQVLGGMMMLPLTVRTLRLAIDIASRGPRDLGIIALATRAREMPNLPPDRVGSPALVMTLVWSGEMAEGEAVLDRLRSCADEVIFDSTAPISYDAMYQISADAPKRVSNITENFFADELDDDALVDIVEAVIGGPRGDVFSGVEIRVLGGAIAEVSDDATAYAHRERKLLVSTVCAGFPTDRVGPYRNWLTSLDRKLGRLSLGRYVNFLESAAESRLDDVYPPATAVRLSAVKRRYDPDNCFSANFNVPPGI